MANPYSLLNGNQPTIQTAINKTKFFVNKAQEVHGDRYDYKNSEYKRNHDKVDIICKEHGVFKQKPNGHLMGNGCPECNKGGWEFKLSDWLNTKGEEATFYVLRCFSDDEEFVKIGITSDSIKERYRKKKSMPYDYEVIHETTSNNKKMIWEIERKFIKKLNKYQYIPNKKFGGFTECFNVESIKMF